jgi:hypothetical protein
VLLDSLDFNGSKIGRDEAAKEEEDCEKKDATRIHKERNSKICASAEMSTHMNNINVKFLPASRDWRTSHFQNTVKPSLAQQSKGS